MRILALLFYLAGAPALFAGTNVLQNSDFSDTISHWDGDCHSAGSSSDDSGSTKGAVVKLRSGDWTSISQDFEGKDGHYTLTVTYLASPGAKFSMDMRNYRKLSPKVGLPTLGNIDGTPGRWSVIMFGVDSNQYDYWTLVPELDAGPHTLTASIPFIVSDSVKKRVVLAFPPGDGFINLQSITLVPDGA